jgi:hypothetical protein
MSTGREGNPSFQTGEMSTWYFELHWNRGHYNISMFPILLYTTADGTTKLQVKLENETVWLTQDQMALLFDKSKSTLSEHI